MPSTVSERFAIEVVYAERDGAAVVELTVPPGTTALNAVERARAASAEFDPPVPWRFGIFGRECRPGTLLVANDRVEVYRPLENDAKTLRRQRAVRQKSSNGV